MFSRTNFHTRVSFRIYRETLSRFSCAASTEGFSANVTNQHKSRYRAKSGNEHGRTCATRHRVDYSQQR
ncbi:hypothetical protein ABLN64_12915 [Mycobacterium tuberculosis]